MTRDRKIVENQGLPEYATTSDLPVSGSPGYAFVQADSSLYKNDGSGWERKDIMSRYDLNYAANEARLVKVRKRLYDALQGGTYNYIISGDSTRAFDFGTVNLMAEYYRYQLSKLGATMTVFDNCDSGDTAAGWLAGTGDVKWSDANAQISGTGANSILEFSFGINDWTATPNYATVKLTIKNCIDTMLAAKADLAIILVSPVRTGQSTRNVALENIYEEVANEYQLPFISGYDAVNKIYAYPGSYYQDATHPNEWGCKRIVNYILDRILPVSLFSTVTLQDMFTSSANLAGTIISGKYWSTGTGAETVGAAWRSLPEFSIYGATSLVLNHQGNRRDVVCMTSGDVFIGRLLIDASVAPGRKIYLPYNTAKVRINIADNGATYDALNDVVSVYANYMSQADINKYLNLRNTVA